MTSPYTRLGPFVDGGAPYLSAATFNHFEDGLSTVTAVAAPDPTGVAATDTTNLQTAISTAQANGQSLQLRSGTYVINTGLAWDLTRGDLRGIAGTVIDATAMTSGVALSLNAGNANNTGRSHKATKYTVGGFELLGPDTDTTTVDGISTADTGDGLDNGTLEHIFISGFRDQLTYGANEWTLTCLKVTCKGFHRYAVNLPTATNSGENQTFIGCNFANGSSTNNAVALKITGNVDASFIGCSFDYNPIEASIEAGAARFFGCHFEDKSSANNMVRVQQGVASTARTIVEFHSCTFALTETTGTNRAIVEILSGSSAKVHVSWFGGNFGPYNLAYRLYVNNSTATPRIRHDGTYLDVTGTTAIGTVGDDTNMLAAPGFEGPAAFAGAQPSYAAWSHGGSVTWSVDSGSPRSGSYALKVVGTGTGGSSCSQNVPISAGRTPFIASGWMQCTAWTAGTITLTVRWYAGDGTTTLRIDNVGQNSGAISSVQGYTPFAGIFVAPAGASIASVQVVASSTFNGTAYIDDLGLWAV